MSIFEKKEKNLNELINKLDVLTSTYSQSSYETEKIKTEKNEILRQKSEIEKKNQELMREHKYLKEKKVKIIGVGGVDSADSAYDKIINGASLIQLYTGMVYRGPGIAKKISEDLNNIFKKQGVTNISELVGSKK